MNQILTVLSKLWRIKKIESGMKRMEPQMNADERRFRNEENGATDEHR